MVAALAEAGCRDLLRLDLGRSGGAWRLPDGCELVVLHGVGPDDVEAALASTARPVLNTLEQVARWREIAPDRPCDVMVDTGMNRLGLRPDEIGALDGLAIDTLHSHLACADEDSAMNARQLRRFRAVAGSVAGEALQPRQFGRHLPWPRL